jgi:photosystem II stability/assembly factor-like uncharacterized protein
MSIRHNVLLVLLTIFSAGCTPATEIQLTPEPSFGGEEMALSSTIPVPTATEISPRSTDTLVATFTQTPSIAPIAQIFSPEKTTPSETRENRKMKKGERAQFSVVHMFPEGKGWGLEKRGYIMHSNDGGETWFDVTPDYGCFNEEGFFALDGTRAWATQGRTTQNADFCPYLKGTTGILWTTVNSGNTWEHGPVIKELQLSSLGIVAIQFISEKEGYLSWWEGGEHTYFPGLLETKNGGENWSKKDIGHTDGFNVFGGIAFFHDGSGIEGDRLMLSQGFFGPPTYIKDYLSGNFVPEIYISERKNEPFKEQNLPRIVQFPQKYRSELNKTDSNNPLKGVCDTKHLTTIGNHGIAVWIGCGDIDPLFQVLYYSSNNGQTWLQWLSNQSDYFLEENTGWRVNEPESENESRYFQITRNAGSTWENLTLVTWASARFSFIDLLNGWAVTGDKNSWKIAGNSSPTSLLRTSDGGRTWTELPATVQ